MNRSPLIYDRNGELTALCLQQGPFAEKFFSLDLRVCSSPLCKCSEITLRCSRHEHESAASPVTMDITLDLTKCILAAPSASASQRLAPEALSMAEALTGEMDAGDWKDLYKRFRLLKQAQTERADWKSLSVTFPSENMNNPSLMVAYKDIFPWCQGFEFLLEKEQWFVDDRYCVNPECSCQDVLFRFLHVASASGSRPRIVQETSPALYTLTRGTFKPMHPPWATTPLLDSLADALRKAHPSLDEKIRKRREQLRALYKTAIERESPKRPFPTIQVRDPLPNDRCPCGSGKKFKKCCGQTV